MFVRALKTAPAVAEESIALISRLAEGARQALRQARTSGRMVDEVYDLKGLEPGRLQPKAAGILRHGPFFNRGGEFAEQFHSTLKNGSATDKPGVLLEIEEGVNTLRERSFPYVPVVIVRSADSTSNGSAFRNRIYLNYDIERVAGELKVGKFGKPERETALASTTSHEFAHLEQSALRWWRLADRLEIGKRPLPGQMRALLRTDADGLKMDKQVRKEVMAFHKYGRPPSGRHSLEVVSNGEFVDHVLRFRDGRQLTPSQQVRADRLIESIAKGRTHAPLFNRLFDDHIRTQFILNIPPPTTPADFIAFHRRVLSSPLPSKMVELVVRKGVLSPLPPQESGRTLYQAFSKYADTAFQRYKYLGYRPYRNAYHEREAHAFGDNVGAHYELRTLLSGL